jgi:murein DD-endopeptidase MepM/ murein hydrolase activator NlpD
VILGVIDKLKTVAFKSAAREKANYLRLNEAETEAIDFIVSSAKTLIYRGLSTVGSWFVRMVTSGIKYAVIPMFKVLKFAVGTAFRLILINPWVIGTLAAACAAYLVYRKFFAPEQAKEKTSRMEEAVPVQPGKGKTREALPVEAGEVPSTEATKAPSTTTPEGFEPAETAPTPAKRLPSLSKPASTNKDVLAKAMEGKITDKRERAAFLAQMHHESNGFASMVEEGEPSYFKKYEFKKNLGNTKKGDGERYKGRGFIQLTGRSNYEIFGKKIGQDLINNPELAADPEIAAQIALSYWESRGSGKAARGGDYDAVTRSINPGMKGKADRDAKYAMYLASLGIDAKGQEVKIDEQVTSTDKTKATETKSSSVPKGVSLQIPTYGRLSSTYGTRVDPVSGSFERQHRGIDIAAPIGTPIYAATSGRAIVTPNTKSGYGNLLDIIGSEYDTRYAHLSSFEVGNGAQVAQGQVVAKVGNTGRSTGAHLHFEVRDKTGKDLDPATVMVLPPKGQIEKSMVVPVSPPSNRDVEIINRNGKLVRLEK